MDVYDIRGDVRVQELLRDMADSPHILYCSEEPLLLFRHNRMKRVVLVVTPYYVYLLKQKRMTFYFRWPNDKLSLRSAQNNIFINAEGPDAATAASAEPSDGKSDVKGEMDFRSVKLEAASAAEAIMVERCLQDLADGAKLRRAVLTARETAPADARDDDEENEENEENDEANVSQNDAAAFARAHPNEEEEEDEDDPNGPRGAFLPSPPIGDKSRVGTVAAGAVGAAGLFQKSPSRYLAVASLVDGEFTDYGALRNAYVRREEARLLDDLAALIRENEGQVERLCEQHYPAFLHAARQCLAISETDAELVAQELGGATALTRASVVAMKRSAADVNVSRCVGANVGAVLALLRAELTVAELLETAESRARRQQLLGAVIAMKRLLYAATPLAEYALGEYVIHRCVPRLARGVFASAVQRLNAWLKLLREESEPVGAAALAWDGVARSGSVAKRLLRDPQTGEWWVHAGIDRAVIQRAPFAGADALEEILRGAAVQGVFAELRREAYFTSYYAESRSQQARLDLYESPCKLDGVDGTEIVAGLERYCATALGFILIEDIVHHATRPHVQSAADVLAVWEQLSQTLVERVRRIASALVTDAHYTERMMEVFKLLRLFTHVAVDSVTSVPLSPLALSRVVELMSDSIVSAWLQEACVEVTQVVLGDTLLPLSVQNASEYTAYVERFSLSNCPALEFPIPPRPGTLAGPQGTVNSNSSAMGRVSLPYALMVPTIGDIALRFLSRCHSIMVTDSGAVVRQSELNNVDEMLLKYLSVLFRTVGELLQGHLASVQERAVMQLAVYVTSCAALGVVVSCVEQHFVLAWPGDYDGRRRQCLGEPRLLAPSAALFAKAVQRGIERLLAAVAAEVEDRMRPTTDAAYWRRLTENRRNGAARRQEASTEKGLPEAFDYMISMIPKLQVVLQTTVARSVVGTVIAQAALAAQANIEKAVHEGCGEASERECAAMRECVIEFEQMCTLMIPAWQKRIEAVISGLSVAQRFPLHPRQISEDLMQWITRREAEAAEERATANQLVAGIEEAGKFVAKGVGRGFQVVGNTVKGSANVITGAANALKGKRE